MSKIAALAVALSLVGFGAHAQQLPVHTEGGIAYVSGGIGQEERNTILAIEKSYSLRLLFVARDTGEYLGSVKVKLVGGGGKVLLEAVSDGPYFLAELSPGKYDVVVDYAGKTLTEAVDIRPGSAVSHSFYWPSAN